MDHAIRMVLSRVLELSGHFQLLSFFHQQKMLRLCCIKRIIAHFIHRSLKVNSLFPSDL